MFKPSVQLGIADVVKLLLNVEYYQKSVLYFYQPLGAAHTIRWMNSVIPVVVSYATQQNKLANQVLKRPQKEAFTRQVRICTGRN